MYATLQYTSGWTASAVLSDLVSVLTGTTSVGALTGPTLNVGASTISTTWQPAGWELYDNVSATNKVIRSPIADIPTAHKYVRLYVSSNTIVGELYESWNNVTHVGTNLASRTITAQHETNTANTIELHISASARYIGIMELYSNLTLTSSPGFIFEHTRKDTWYTTTAVTTGGFKPVVIGQIDNQRTSNTGAGFSPFATPKIRRMSSTEIYYGTQAGFNWEICGAEGTFGKMGTNASPNKSSWYYADGTTKPVLLDFGCASLKSMSVSGATTYTVGSVGGDISTLCDVRVYTSPTVLGLPFDVFVINGVEYRNFYNGDTHFVVRNG